MSLYIRVFNSLPGWLKRRIFPLDYLVSDFVKSINPSASSRVLDAGAGEVRFSETFQKGRYLTIDAAVGDDQWDYSKIDIQGRLELLPFPNGSFDYVINTQVLEHVVDPQVVIKELFRVLRKDGTLYLTAPQGWHEHQQPNDYFRFTQYSLRNLMKNAGFSTVEIAPLGGYFHYLGHRLTYIPKILFQENKGLFRLLLLPFEFLSLVIFCFFMPIICYYLDRLDRKKEFTLCYRCRAKK